MKKEKNPYVPVHLIRGTLNSINGIGSPFFLKKENSSLWQKAVGTGEMPYFSLGKAYALSRHRLMIKERKNNTAATSTIVPPAAVPR